MSNEIKEILFLLHNDRLTESGKRKLEDYITNLQEENERLKQNLSKGITNNLENKYLNNKLYKDLEDYKTRNEKAIEYIKTKEVDFVDCHYQQQDDYFDGLLNLLQGKSDE